MNSTNTAYQNAMHIQRALAAQQRGEVDLASHLFEQVLAGDPTHPDALHFLGLMRHRADKSSAALKMVEESIRAAPKNPHFLSNLGAIYAESGDRENAMRCYRKALSILPSLAEAQNNLGNLYLAANNPASALVCFRKAAACKQGYIEPIRGIGAALRAQGKKTEARQHLEAAIKTNPYDAALLLDMGSMLFEAGEKQAAIDLYKIASASNPGAVTAQMAYANALRDSEQFTEAELAYRQVLALDPNNIEALCYFADLLRRRKMLPEASGILAGAVNSASDNPITHFFLGAVYLDQEKHAEAAACFQRAIDLNPRWEVAFHNQGTAFALSGDHIKARQAYQNALAISPGYVLPQLGISSSLILEGDIENAIVALRKTIALDPDYYGTYMGLHMALQYSDQTSPQALLDAHLAFADRFEGPHISAWPDHSKTHTNTSDRRLRIGYVSGDFYNHSVAYFIEPILEKHNKEKFEIFCYSNSLMHDAFTDRIQKHADHWAVCAEWTDEELSNRIQADKIDILLDLSGHTAHNRLRTFARKPAPVQATWIGYPGTTGLKAMDYRITDDLLDPVGVTDSSHTEKLFRLDRRPATFRPPVANVPINPLVPALRSGTFTFASLNSPAKTSRHSILLWARILNALPNTRMIIGNADAPAYVDRLKQTFAEFGIGEDRLSLHPRVPTDQFLAMHNEIDICLDTFPYNGGTTTTLSIWMGVPTITLAGVTTASRCGTATMSQLGLKDFIAKTDDEYVACAQHFANDLPALSTLRTSMREILETSIYDATLATASLENALLDMWAQWCVQVNTANHE